MSKDGLPRFAWDDLEKFREIARGIERGELLDELGARLGLEGPRMIKLRIERLEEALGLGKKGLVEQHKYEKEARLTDEGTQLAKFAARLSDLREEVEQTFLEGKSPVVRIATNLPALFIVAPEVFRDLVAQRWRQTGRADLGFRPEYLWTEDYSAAMRRVAEGRADLAIFCRTPVNRTIPTARQLELEVLIATDVSVLVPGDHRFVVEGTRDLRVRDLAGEHIVARPLYKFLFPGSSPEGGWTPVVDSADVPAYLRMGIGVGLNTHFGFRFLNGSLDSPREGEARIHEIPLKTPNKVDICLIRPTEPRRWREIGPEAEQFLATLREFYRKKREESRPLAR